MGRSAVVAVSAQNPKQGDHTECFCRITFRGLQCPERQDIMGAPVNVKLRAPTESIETWPEEETQWITLNKEAKGNPEFYPLTIKAAYVVGVIHSICESVSRLLDPNAIQTTYIPAYGVFSSGIDILGRCVAGNSTYSSRGDVKVGFKWLVRSAYESVPDDHVLIKTSNFEYTIDMLTDLRHFAAHGQAASKKMDEGTYLFRRIDYEILGEMSPLLADGLARYWNELIHDESLCNRLARANIIRLREWPIVLSWTRFDRDEFGEYHGVADIFKRFDWRVNKFNWR